MKYFKDCQTLDEAKKLFRKLVFQTHPDHGGTDEAFNAVVESFEAFKPSKEIREDEYKNWNGKTYAEIINQLLIIAKTYNIEIEIIGSWIWVSGETKAAKDMITAIPIGDSMKRAFRWKKVKWSFFPADYKKMNKKTFTHTEIQDMYGSTKIEQEEQEKRKQIERPAHKIAV